MKLLSDFIINLINYYLFHNVEYEVEEQLQTGEIDPNLLRTTIINLRASEPSTKTLAVSPRCDRFSTLALKFASFRAFLRMFIPSMRVYSCLLV